MDDDDDNGKRIWPLVLVVCGLAYFLLAAQPLGREAGAVPRWVMDVTPPSQAAAAAPASAKPAAEKGTQGKTVAFSMPSAFGFFSDSGDLIVSRVPAGRVTLRPEGAQPAWADYPEAHDAVAFRTPSGIPLFALQGPASPFFASGRLFAVEPDDSGLDAYSPDGKLLWSRDLPAVMTVFAASDEEAAAGCLDGSLTVIGIDGSERFSFRPGGSRLSVIIGIALSPDGNRLAVVSGVDPQRFLLFERRADGFSLVRHMNLESSFRRRALVSFTNDGDYALVEQESSVWIVPSAGGTVERFPFAGKLMDILPGASGDAQIIRCSSGRDDRIYTFSVAGKAEISASLGEGGSYLERSGSRLFLGKGNRIARLDLTEY